MAHPPLEHEEQLPPCECELPPEPTDLDENIESRRETLPLPQSGQAASFPPPMLHSSSKRESHFLHLNSYIGISSVRFGTKSVSRSMLNDASALFLGPMSAYRFIVQSLPRALVDRGLYFGAKSVRRSI